MQHYSTAIEGGSSQRPWRTPAGVFLIAWIVLCLPWLSGIKTIPFDAVQQFFPAVGFSAEQLRHLQAPGGIRISTVATRRWPIRR